MVKGLIKDPAGRDLKWLNPYGFRENELPLITFVDDRQSWLSWKIKNHTDSNYNHVMWLYKLGVFASQNPGGYKKLPLHAYDKPRYLLKFMRPKLSDEQRKNLIQAIADDLKNKDSSDSYDWWGILGQLLNLSWLQNKNRTFCSEKVISYLNKLGFNIASHANPGLLNKFLKVDERFETAGYYFTD